MSQGQIEFPLHLKEDRHGDEYMIGSTDLPVTVDLSKLTFIVFFPTDGARHGTMLIRPYKERAMPTKALAARNSGSDDAGEERDYGDEDEPQPWVDPKNRR